MQPSWLPCPCICFSPSATMRQHMVRKGDASCLLPEVCLWAAQPFASCFAWSHEASRGVYQEMLHQCSQDPSFSSFHGGPSTYCPSSCCSPRCKYWHTSCCWPWSSSCQYPSRLEQRREEWPQRSQPFWIHSPCLVDHPWQLWAFPWYWK